MIIISVLSACCPITIPVSRLIKTSFTCNILLSSNISRSVEEIQLHSALTSACPSVLNIATHPFLLLEYIYHPNIHMQQVPYRIEEKILVFIDDSKICITIRPFNINASITVYKWVTHINSIIVFRKSIRRFPSKS